MTLFDPDPTGFLAKPPWTPWQIHSKTSEDAAFAKKPTAAAQRESVFRAIAEAPDGLTDLEIQALLGLSGDSERPRRVELANDRRIVEAGTRTTHTGRQATVWTLPSARRGGEAMAPEPRSES